MPVLQLWKSATKTICFVYSITLCLSYFTSSLLLCWAAPAKGILLNELRFKILAWFQTWNSKNQVSLGQDKTMPTNSSTKYTTETVILRENLLLLYYKTQVTWKLWNIWDIWIKKSNTNDTYKSETLMSTDSLNSHLSNHICELQAFLASIGLF